jgi:hypothetical protein
MANRVYHYRHGWIPLDHEAGPSASGITSSQDLAKATLALPSIKDNQERMAAKLEIRRAAIRLGVKHILPGDVPIGRRKPA